MATFPSLSPGIQPGGESPAWHHGPDGEQLGTTLRACRQLKAQSQPCRRSPAWQQESSLAARGQRGGGSPAWQRRPPRTNWVNGVKGTRQPLGTASCLLDVESTSAPAAAARWALLARSCSSRRTPFFRFCTQPRELWAQSQPKLGMGKVPSHSELPSPVGPFFRFRTRQEVL